MKQTRFAAIMLIILLTLGLTSQAYAQTTIVTPAPSEVTYTVQPGETLFRIAQRFQVTIKQIAEANGITNPSLIFTGQKLRIPGAAATPLPPQQDVTGSGQGSGTAPGYGFAYGIEVFMTGQNIPDVTTSISALGMQWVKQTISWRDIEPVRGQIDFIPLDEVVNNLTSANLKIMFTVTGAPTWARTYILENGPPDNVADYGAFMAALAARYAGRVQAYEIWNEPNRRSEWSCTEDPQNPRFCATRYIDLLTAAYQSIKQADANALVISAGLAPTGFNDGTNAVDDRQFLTNLYAAGLATVSDAVGAHPLGWANPPDSACCSASDGVTTHFEKPSFYFRNTLDEYRQIMMNAGDGSTPIWVTKFGWGSSEDTSPPSENSIYVSYTSLEEQAAYIPRAFALGSELGFIGPMFLDNLNGCQAGGDIESCYYSLVGPNGQSRPLYERLRAAVNPADTPSQPPPTVTPETLLPPEPTATSLPPELPIPEATVEG
jgi:LysM repeat protein